MSPFLMEKLPLAHSSIITYRILLFSSVVNTYRVQKFAIRQSFFEKGLTKRGVHAIISKRIGMQKSRVPRKQKPNIEVWLSLVERYVRDVEVASSNLVTSTIKKAPPLWRCFLYACVWRADEIAQPQAAQGKFACKLERKSKGLGATNRRSAPSCHLDQIRTIIFIR